MALFILYFVDFFALNLCNYCKFCLNKTENNLEILFTLFPKSAIPILERGRIRAFLP